jgi:hypothetical protein
LTRPYLLLHLFWKNKLGMRTADYIKNKSLDQSKQHYNNKPQRSQWQRRQVKKQTKATTKAKRRASIAKLTRTYKARHQQRILVKKQRDPCHKVLESTTFCTHEWLEEIHWQQFSLMHSSYSWILSSLSFLTFPTIPKALFIWLIIRLIQLVFSAGTVFFSQKNQPTVFFSRLIIPAERGIF